MKKAYYWISAAILLVMAWCLWKQFSTVMIYYDDYGYYSLTYGAVGHRGDIYSLSELISFLKNHYMHVNGRILYFFIWLLLYEFGKLKLVQFAAALSVSGIIFLIWKIIISNHRAEPISAMFLICDCYWLIGITMHRQGTYWFAAFWNYVLPLLPFLLFCLLYFQKYIQQKSIAIQLFLTLLIFTAAFSQEQIGVAVVGFTLMIGIWEYVKKNFNRWNIGYILAAMIGSSIVLMSPGIQQRGAQKAMTELPFIQQIACNIKALITLFFNPSNRLFLIALFISCTLISLFMQKQEISKVWKALDCTFAAVCLGLVGVYMHTNLISNAFQQPVATIIIGFGILIVGIIIQVSRFYASRKEYGHLIIFYTAIIAIACLVVVSELPMRLMIFPTFLLFVLVVDGFEIIRFMGVNRRVSLISICIVMCLVAWKNGHNIYLGYSLNKSIHTSNDHMLRDASQKIKDGERISEIRLQKVSDILYCCDMPYISGFEIMVPWIRNYYDLPSEVELRYLDISPEQEVGNTMDTCFFASGHSEDGWLEKDSHIYISSGNSGILNIELYEPKEEYQTMQGRIEINGTSYNLSLDGEHTKLNFKVNPNELLDIYISMDEDYQGDGEDKRRLSVLLMDIQGQ